jgi:hypothetical protein
MREGKVAVGGENILSAARAVGTFRHRCSRKLAERAVNLGGLAASRAAEHAEAGLHSKNPDHSDLLLHSIAPKFPATNQEPSAARPR